MATQNPSPAPAVAVVTVSYGSEAVLSSFLSSVGAASESSIAIAIADNKPEPGGLVSSLATQYGATYLALEQNLGYGGAINAAIASLAENTRWVLVSNPDVVLTPGAIDRLLFTGEGDERIGAVGPQVRDASGAVYPSARAVPSLRTGIGHALFVNLWTSNPWTRAYRRDTEPASEPRDAGWLSGSCLLVRRSAFESLGGFDSGFFMYFEDVDLGYRLGKAGYRNVYEPEAVVIHTGAHATGSDSARMIAAHHESARRFLNKKYAGPILWPVRVALTAGLKLRSSLVRRSLNR